MDSCTVLIVGGGPAGSATAFFLARAGVDVTILERAHFPREKACAEYLSPQASRILHEMDVEQTILSSGAATLAGMIVRSPDGSSFRGNFGPVHEHKPFRDHGVALRRSLLDSILLERAIGAGARVLQGTSVTALRRSGTAVLGVEVRLPDGSPLELSSRLVVGADGLNSTVARKGGLAARRRWPARVALVTHYSGVRHASDCGEMFVQNDGYAGIARTGPDDFNLAIVVPRHRAAELRGDKAEFVRRWITAHPVLSNMFAAARRSGPVLVTGPFARSSRQSAAPGMALVGDAVDFFDPFTGEGIYCALRGAEILAAHTQEALTRQENTSKSGAPAPLALPRYHRAMRSEFRDKRRLEWLIGAAVASPAIMNTLTRRLSTRQSLADTLVGVAGDFVPPREILRAQFLLDLFRQPAA